MRKRIVRPLSRNGSSAGEAWLDLTRLAQVELTSEDPLAPIESALESGTGSGWRAAEPGEQVIRLLFDGPTPLRCIRLVFDEEEVARTQELSLRFSADGGKSYREVVRQQFNFSPPATTREEETYRVDLHDVTTLELRIVPAIGGGAARASLRRLALA